LRDSTIDQKDPPLVPNPEVFLGLFRGQRGQRVLDTETYSRRWKRISIHDRSTSDRLLHREVLQ